LPQQYGVSVGGAWSASEMLFIRPYKSSVVPEIKLCIMKKRVRYCNWFISHYGILDPKLIFFTDEVIFNFSGYVKSRKGTNWNGEYPRPLIQLPFMTNNRQVHGERLAQSRIIARIT
jgi:hypothetical protein